MTNAVMEAAYFQTYFLAQAIEKVKSTDADALIFEGLPGQEFQAPQGKVKIDEKNHHTWLWARIGKANEQGQFDIVWKSEDWIRPDPWVDLSLSEQGLRLHRQACLERVEEAVERGKEPVGNDRLVTSGMEALRGVRPAASRGRDGAKTDRTRFGAQAMECFSRSSPSF